MNHTSNTPQPQFAPVLVARNANKDQVVAMLIAQGREIQARDIQAHAAAGIPMVIKPVVPESELNLSAQCGCFFHLNHLTDIEEGQDILCFHGNKFLEWRYDPPPPPPGMVHPRKCARCDNVGCLQPCFCPCHSQLPA